MNTFTNRFQLPTPTTSHTAREIEAELLEVAPIDESAALTSLADRMESDLAKLEARFVDFVTPNSIKKNVGR